MGSGPRWSRLSNSLQSGRYTGRPPLRPCLNGDAQHGNHYADVLADDGYVVSDTGEVFRLV
jgi:hypothetical protein